MTLRTIALLSVSAIAFSLPAAAQPQGWYLGAGAGWSSVGSSDFNVKPPAGPVNGSVGFGDNVIGDLTVGYKFGDFRVELEGSYAEYGVDHIHVKGVGSTSPSGEMPVTSIFANAIYDWPLTDRLSLSLGGGLGMAQVDPSFHNATQTIHGSDTAFSWQAIAGLTYALNDRFEVEASYRYQGIEGTHHGYVGELRGSTEFRSKDTQSVMMNLRWYLNGPKYAPAPQPQQAYYAPPPPPPPPAAVKTFVVFFDFNKSNLSGEARSIVAEAVKTTQETGAARIVITGHTDTVGSAAYNQALSEQRAEAVKAQMIADGLSDADILTVGKGFSDPLVSTGPGVREPQNRRAVIDLGGTSS